MTSDENQTPDNEQNPAANAAEENLAADNDPALDPSAIAEQLATDNADLKDRLLRLAADMENLRKRTEREISDARNYAIANFARDMLVATDNLSRAIVMLPQEARDSNDPSMKALIEGIEMTDREMQRLLQKNGVKPIMAEGEKFDPHKHQAMFEVPNSGATDGTVVQVVQAGFAIGDRVLRPAMVGVAKGGPKAPPNGSAPEGSTIDKEA